MPYKLAKLLAKLPTFRFEHGYFAHYDKTLNDRPSKMWLVWESWWGDKRFIIKW